MIGAFIGGFIAGGLVTFILLVIMAICSLKSKQRKIKEVIAQSPFKPYAQPFDFKDVPYIHRKKGSPRISKLENYTNNNVKKDGAK